MAGLKPNTVSAMVGMPTTPGRLAIALRTGMDLDRFFLALDFQSPFVPSGVIVLYIVMAVSGWI